mgnify:FL=1
MALIALPSFPIFSSFSEVVRPDNPAIAAPKMSVVQASSTLHGGGSKTSPEFRRMKLSDCALAYSLRSPLQSIIPPSHCIRIASSRESMYSFTLLSTITKSIARAVGARVVSREVAASVDATYTRVRRDKSLFAFPGTGSYETCVSPEARGTDTARAPGFFVTTDTRPTGLGVTKLEASVCVAIVVATPRGGECQVSGICQVSRFGDFFGPHCIAESDAIVHEPAQSPIRTMGSTPHNPAALAEAQSASEMFDVMHAPAVHFDIFRDKGIPTGETKKRGDVHRDADWHRSVHVWLVDPRKQLVALQKRSKHKDTFPNRWDISAAGHIESKQESRDTAVRELAEELGVVVDANQLNFHFTVPAEQATLGGCNCFEDVYFLECDSSETQFTVGEQEVTDVQWMAMNVLEKKLTEGDEMVVPRTPKYVEAFFATLKGEYGSKK